jgi:hypothetical protein
VTTLSNEADSNSDDSMDSDVMDKQYMEREMQMRQIKNQYDVNQGHFNKKYHIQQQLHGASIAYQTATKSSATADDDSSALSSDDGVENSSIGDTSSMSQSLASDRYYQAPSNQN